MGTRARLLRVIAFAGIVLCASRAFAKPTIYVTVTIDPAEKRLREKMTRDLGLAQTPTTMEMFLAERFIETFSRHGQRARSAETVDQGRVEANRAAVPT